MESSVETAVSGVVVGSVVCWGAWEIVGQQG